jgi:hypothetical protein
MAIEFSLDPQELAKTLKPFFAGRARGEEAALDYVDISAQGDEVEFISTGVSSSLPAQVTAAGHARIPYAIFETLFRHPKKLGSEHLNFHVSEGQIKVGSAAFKHQGITIPTIGARIADLPIDAPLMAALALNFRFTSEELMDSGLSARAMEAQRNAEEIIDDAARVLEPLKVERAGLRQFVWEQIRKRFTHKL